MFLLSAVKKDLGRLRRDPLGLATSLGIPLVLVTLITLVFGGGGAVPQGRLLVADEDGTLLSQALTGVFSREPLAKMLVVETTRREEGRRRMDRGDASALLIVPKGFEDAYLQNQPVQLQLVTNPAQEILPRIIGETLSIAVDGGFYLRRVAAVPLSGIALSIAANGSPTDAAVADGSVALNRLGQSLAKFLNPPLIGLDLRVVAAKRENQNIAALFLPSMIFMGLLFVANAHALDIWREHAWGTLRRLATTPASLAAFLGARLISLAVILSAVALTGVAGMRWVAHIPVASLPLAVLWNVLSGLAFYLLLIAIALYTSNQRTANVVGNLVIFPLSLVGGSFFPFEMMPPWMASIGRYTPNGWAVTEFKAFVAGSAHAMNFLVASGCIALAGSFLFFVALRRIRKLA
jgi:ABC-type transport system involved in multi-copper enzyme maturation permease subunit